MFCLVVVGARICIEFMTNQGTVESLSLIVRDSAPWLYLGAVPLFAVALTGTSRIALVWVVRSAACVGAFVLLLSTILLNTQLLGSNVVADSENLWLPRSDLTGITLGIGIVAWGAWPQTLPARKAVQISLLAVGFLAHSRAGLLAVLIGLAVAAIRSWNQQRQASAVSIYGVGIVVGIGLTVLASLIPGTSLPAIPGTSPPDVQTASPKTPGMPLVPQELETHPNVDDASNELVGVALPRIASVNLEDGTTGARIETWSMIAGYLSGSHQWLFGAGPGTPSLSIACSQNVGRTSSPATSSANLSPSKCPVSSFSAASTLRDPHSWVFFSLLYFGLLGLLSIIAGLIASLFAGKESPLFPLTSSAVLIYALVGLFGVIISGPYALVPLAIFLGWNVSSSIEFPPHHQVD